LDWNPIPANIELDSAAHAYGLKEMISVITASCLRVYIYHRGANRYADGKTAVLGLSFTSLHPHKNVRAHAIVLKVKM
jgi:hypothetical protein